MKIKNKYKILIYIIIGLALAIRLAYIIKMPYTEKQHDVEPNGNGLSYIFTIYETGHLPQDNIGQHYHPPLHQIICAIFLKIVSIFNTDTNFMYESLQFVTLIDSMALVFIIYKILQELHIKEKYKILAMIVAAFHPTLIILSGSLNNDCLCLTLTIWTILRLIKWYKNDNIKNTILLAIITGLCVMAKTSGAIVAIPIMYVFLLKLYRKVKKSENKVLVIKKYMYLFIFFGCISLPIGLLYPIRNYIEFGQPILYVMDPHNSDLYVGNYTLWQRFLPFSNEINQMYCDPWNQYNIPIFLLKCSLFGEYSWNTNGAFEILYVVSILANIYLIIQTIYCIISQMMNKTKRNKQWKIAFLLLFIFNIFSYITMNIKLPYGCTMDFRYIASTVFTGTMFVIFEMQSIKQTKIIYYLITTLTVIMCLSTDTILLLSQV